MAMGFREYFLTHAELADDLYTAGHHINCYMTATAAIDALAAIWETDFLDESVALRREFGGSVPASARMARFVRRFSGDPKAARVAVIRFAEDAKRFGTLPPPESLEVEGLLKAREPPMRGAMPPAYLDTDLDELARQAPTLMANPNVRKLAEEYQYPGLLYSLYRCPTVHLFTWPAQEQTLLAIARSSTCACIRTSPVSASGTAW
jgi:hypothetical protein